MDPQSDKIDGIHNRHRILTSPTFIDRHATQFIRQLWLKMSHFGNKRKARVVRTLDFEDEDDDPSILGLEGSAQGGKYHASSAILQPSC